MWWSIWVKQFEGDWSVSDEGVMWWSDWLLSIVGCCDATGLDFW